MNAILILAGAFVVVAPPSLAAEAGERTKLAGSWQEGSGDSGKTWTLRESGDEMQVSETAKGEKLIEFHCNTIGRECAVKDGGKHIKVSMWFNGPKLVVMETRGSEVLKRRFGVSGDGGAMEMEVIPIAPAGKPETIALKRIETTNAQ